MIKPVSNRRVQVTAVLTVLGFAFLFVLTSAPGRGKEADSSPVPGIKIGYEKLGRISVLVGRTQGRPCSRYLLLFHGCGHDAEDFVRLPEERLFLAAFGTSFCWIAYNSSDRAGVKCWGEPDLAPVLETISHFGKAGLVAVGVSSGGVFAQRLVGKSSTITGVVTIVAPAMPELVNERWLDRIAIVYMPGDTVWATEASATSFKSPAKVLVVESPKQQFTPELAQMRGLDWKSAEKYLDIDWFPASSNVLIPDNPGLQQTLRMCRAEHEMTSYKADEIAQFFSDF